MKYLLMLLVLILPTSLFAGAGPDGLDFGISGDDDEELLAFYDLRDRKTFIQVTNKGDDNEADIVPLVCIHIQIFQQDRGCVELDFEDELTHNDTVIYDLDNLVRNNGTEVPINLGDDSYGYVAISAFDCETENDDVSGIGDPLIGNFRIIDEIGDYEYRMNLFSEEGDEIIESFDGDADPVVVERNPIILFNRVDGVTHSDIVGFVYQENEDATGVDGIDENEDVVRNLSEGVTFSLFLVDENEERLSCDEVNFACGPGKKMYYGLNEDLPASRGENLLCNGGGLLPGQTHGYVSLENAVIDDGDDTDADEYEFVCMIGVNNNNGTGSLVSCQYECNTDLPGCDVPDV